MLHLTACAMRTRLLLLLLLPVTLCMGSKELPLLVLPAVCRVWRLQRHKRLLR
jgi:hypothetical protein